jgi:hypothetical protein
MPKDGVLTSIDTERELSAAARSIFQESGISAQRFRLITGVINDVVGKLADGNYDLVVIRTSADLMDLIHEARSTSTSRWDLADRSCAIRRKSCRPHPARF